METDKVALKIIMLGISTNFDGHSVRLSSAVGWAWTIVLKAKNSDAPISEEVVFTMGNMAFGFYVIFHGVTLSWRVVNQTSDFTKIETRPASVQGRLWCCFLSANGPVRFTVAHVRPMTILRLELSAAVLVV